MSLNLLNKAKILIVGDAMLDEYWFGDASRISPEAPVPIVKITRSEERLGGAANVAFNISSIGASASLLTIIGEDASAEKIDKLLEKAQINANTIKDASISTTVKLRIMARQQQMIRCDFESHPSEEKLQALANQFNELIDKHDLIVLSDYAKGTLRNTQNFLSAAKEKGKKVIVDPKGDDFQRYRGAYLLTPNCSELRLVVGQWSSETDLHERAQKLRDSLSLDYLLLTRSEEGMTLFGKDTVITVPAQAREVFDVSGAGDTVVSVLACAIAVGIPVPEAVKIANKAGGIVVGKVGTATVTLDELAQ